MAWSILPLFEAYYIIITVAVNHVHKNNIPLTVQARRKKLAWVAQ